MAKMILIADDDAINRKILNRGLRSDYDILEAGDGEEAINVINHSYKQLSAVLLDISMPVMNGFEVLSIVRQSANLTHIPIIVVTGSEDEDTRLHALRLGANDFIQKPCNLEIIKHCLQNNIIRSETTSIVDTIQKDNLTGIYNREYFFEKAGDMIRENEYESYVLECFDIDNFKIVNDQYGTAEGDKILRHIGLEMQKVFDKVKGICGRISGDNFAALYPNITDISDYVTRCRESKFIAPDTSAILQFSTGCYVVTDLSLPVSALYDRAYIAKQSVKGRYDVHIAYFDDSMLRTLVLKQEITGEMDRALTKREFEVWLQPQYNHATGALIGAEALVRWRHPSRGLIPPADFILVFEENGFIYELDKYVWEETCRYLRKWLDMGRKPLPVSVNISRYDLFKDDILDVLNRLLITYDLPVDLLRLEITESAFSESAERVIVIVKQFIEHGFTVEIDDFGSGFSSLNTLKDVPAQILKLDMNFLEEDESEQRGGSILESIIRMARWIGMAVIAEGVETLEQADFLKSIGCNYVQGYLYGRPMMVEEYEDLAKNAVKEERLISSEPVVNLDSDSFWNPKSLDTLIFNSFIGGACVFEFCSDVVELLRINDEYIRELGIRHKENISLGSLDPFKYLDNNGKRTVHEMSERAINTSQEQTCELMLSDDGTYFESVQYIRCTFRVIAKAGDRFMFYCVISNITERTEANEQLQFLNDMAHELLAQPDAEEGLNATLHKLREYFDSERAYIFEFDFKKNTASNTYEACAEGIDREKGNLQNVSLDVMSFWLEAFKHQDYYTIEDINTLHDDRREERDFLAVQGIRSIFVVPLYRNGSLIGMIGIENSSRKYAQMSRLAALGDYIAVMLTRRDLSSQIIGEDKELLLHLRKQGSGLRELTEKTHKSRRMISPTAFLVIMIVCCAALFGLAIFASPTRQGARMDSFSETVLTMSDGWTMTDSSGVSHETNLPLTIDYGKDGIYTFSIKLPEATGIIASPAICFYSNYVDLYVKLGEELIYSFPDDESPSYGATGNTYHFIRLPSDYLEKDINVEIHCQLGDDITYLLKPPLFGSKATMLFIGIIESLPSIMLSGCMMVLAVVLAVLYVFLRRRLELNSATAYTSIFAILFSVYVFCETYFAQMIVSNGRALFSCTLMLLALLPSTLMGLFGEEVSSRFRPIAKLLMALCLVNFTVQAIINYSGISSLRVTLPATHAVIIVSITVMVFSLLFSDREEKPAARRVLFASLPMIAGGMADIVLIGINRPSFNNSLWFTIGVTSFIVIQFINFVHSFFIMYRTSLEASVLRDMAYRDALTNTGNRNAYERKLKDLSERRLSEDLCCLVVDINDLKRINDTYGHPVGDAAIVETARILSDLMPNCASCFRAGGDEFIAILDGYDGRRAEALADKLVKEAERRGSLYSIPLSLAVGCGSYEAKDGNILDFVRRVDALMYSKKRDLKESDSYQYSND